jgi:hypothetical protein
MLTERAQPLEAASGFRLIRVIDVPAPAGSLPSEQVVEGRLALSPELRAALRPLAEHPRDTSAIAKLTSLFAAQGLPLPAPPGVLSVSVSPALARQLDDPAVQSVSGRLNILGVLHVDR